MSVSSILKFPSLAKCAAAVILAAAYAVPATAQIASGTTGIDATGNAQSEMAACATGATQQSRETCMTEVRNATAAKRAGKVDNAGGSFESNARLRCDALTGEDKVACEVRVMGFGNPQGSVAGGGVLREIDTVTTPADGSTVRVQPQTSSDTILVIPGARQ